MLTKSMSSNPLILVWVNLAKTELGEHGIGRILTVLVENGIGRNSYYTELRNSYYTELGENGIDGKHLVMTGEAGLSGLFEIE